MYVANSKKTFHLWLSHVSWINIVKLRTSYIPPIPFVCTFIANQFRISFAAAREGHFPEIFSMISITRRTPLPAILFSIVSLIYLIENDIIVLVEYLGFADVVFETITVAIVPYYRWKYPDLPRPYKVNFILNII